eukprot:CAMPEP_0116894042 /NCGR_PEP_ID=MMETSP0467-20121206/3912_1 /TAXON_ID=283647 /ORGANISM="Mesodinium pulex, Strain SPMC105" /LENGTH=64 /DNA_ID=CAMNT_0004564069 /DNA_START=200 /DNA_END=394 /DNA_ORIENTATION=+
MRLTFLKSDLKDGCPQKFLEFVTQFKVFREPLDGCPNTNNDRTCFNVHEHHGADDKDKDKDKEK